jgi:hypothetical protein
VPAVARAVDEPLLLQVAEDLFQALAAEALSGREGQLEGRALDVADQDVQVLRVDAGLLDGGVEEVVGMFGDELVEGVEFATSTATDEPCRRPARPACCQAEATLPG